MVHKIIHKLKSKIKVPYLINGCKNIWAKKYKTLFVLMFLFAIGSLSFTLLQDISKIKIEWLTTFLSWCIAVSMTVTILVGVLLIISLIGTPHKAKAVEQALHKIKLVDRTDTPPLLVSRYKEAKADVFEFFSTSISLSDFEKKRTDIETALNTNIVDIKSGKDFQHILLKTVPANIGLPDKIEWNDSMLSQKYSELVLGESQLDTVTVDLNVTPHLLIGGSSGSGKSVLFKVILAQSILKGYDVYIADFKGGVDFNGFWRRKCEVITDEKIGIEEARKKLLKRFDYIIKELEVRKELFLQYQCNNIEQYNRVFNCSLQRIVFGCDEIAELLDKTGLDKDSKAVVVQIESRLSIIARQGRAFGITLLLATQRPDSDILKGQIKNNMDYRICGRADKVLSQIILDNSDASEKISKEQQGVFLTNTGVLFKAFYLSDDYVF